MLPVNGGPAQALAGDGWFAIDGVRRLGPGGDLLVVGKRDKPTYAQIYLVPIHGGPIRAITHDFSDYLAVRPTADGKELLAVQRVLLNTLQTIAPDSDSEPTPLSVGGLTRDGEEGLAIAPNGNIVYTSYSDRRVSLAVLDKNGNSHAIRESEEFIGPSISPDGNLIVAAQWLANGHANLFLIDTKSGRETRLSDGQQDYSPSFTADGQWVVYASILDDRPVLMKIPVKGGTPVPLTDYSADFPVVSPDGRWIACFSLPKPEDRPMLAIVPVSGGTPVKTLKIPSTLSSPVLAWTPDSKSVAFIDDRNQTSNIWKQSMDGDKPIQMTHLKSGKIFYFQWSRRKDLVLSRGSEATDAILIKQFR